MDLLSKKTTLKQHLQLESSLWKVDSGPKTSWCLALAKLNCGRNHCDFTLKTLVVTLLFTVSPGIWYYF